MSTFATSTVESPQPPAHQCAVNVSVDLSSVKQLVLSRVKPPWIRVVKQLAPWLLTSAERQTVKFVFAVQQSSFLDDHVQCRFFLNIDIDVIRYQNIRSIKSILRTSTCYTYEVNRKFINIWYENKRLSFFYFLFCYRIPKSYYWCVCYMLVEGGKIGFKFIQFSLNLLNKTGFLILFLLKQILT